MRVAEPARARRSLIALLAATVALALGAIGCGDDTDSESPASAPPAAAQTTFETTTVAEIAPEVEAREVLLVDVREPNEWRAGHAPDAVHVPLSSVAARLGKIEQAAAGRPVAFICRSGSRSAQAAQIAVDGGIADVLSVDGGMGAWAAAGLPLQPRDGTII